MATFYLLNSVTVNRTPFKAGALIDSAVHTAAGLAAIQGVGGVLWPSDDPSVAAAAAIVAKMWAKGADENNIGRVMMAAAALSAAGNPDTLVTPQVVLTSADQAETLVFSLAGKGTVLGAYYLPNAASAPAAGSNNQVLLLNMNDATGTLVGALATGTLANATPMVKWARFSLGALTNAVFLDGYTVTATVTHTGTAVLPAGQWVLVVAPKF